jgi:hypothetical protein
MFLFLKKNLTEMATNSERVAGAMRTIAHVSSSGNIRTKYERFSADNGVCFIKMDKYKKLAEIERLTLEYLGNDTIKQKLSRVAGEIALDYLAKHSAETVTTATDRLAVPQRTDRPQTPVSQTIPTWPQSDETPSSTRQSTDHSEASVDNTRSRDSSTKAAMSTASSSVEPSPSRQMSNIVESILQAGVARTGPVLAN